METNQEKKNPPLRLVVGVIAALVVVAGAGIYAVYRPREPRIGSTNTTGATSHLDLGVPAEKVGRVNADAHARLTLIRCERDERCQNVGQGKRYTDRKACESERRAQTATQLPPERCMEGIDPAKVEVCASAIHMAGCDPALDALDTFPSCKAEVLCQ